MTPCECSARAGFQVPLEANSPFLVRELDHDVKLPRPAKRGVFATPGVVVCQSCVHVGGETNVIAWVLIGVSKNVDESLVARHRSRLGKSSAWTAELKMGRSSSAASEGSQIVRLTGHRPRDFLPGDPSPVRFGWFTEPKLGQAEG